MMPLAINKLLIPVKDGDLVKIDGIDHFVNGFCTYSGWLYGYCSAIGFKAPDKDCYGLGIDDLGQAEGLEYLVDLAHDISYLWDVYIKRLQRAQALPPISFKKWRKMKPDIGMYRKIDYQAWD